MRLADEVLDILANHIAIDPAAFTLRVTIRLDDNEKLYQAVAGALTSIGGIYRSTGKKSGVFRFPYDPSDLIGAILETGEVNPGAFFPTPKAVADQMVAELDGMIEFSDEDDVALEPSAGQGVFIRALLDAGWNGKIVAVENDPTNLAYLRRHFGSNPQVIIVDSTFEDYDGAHGPFWVIVMNPPFTVKGKTTTYIDHIRKAFGMLRHGGEVKAIAPLNWRWVGSQAFREFAAFVTRYGESEDLPKGTFSESGTDTDTCIITLSPAHANNCDDPVDGYPNHWVRTLDIRAEQERSFINAKYDVWRRLQSGEGFDWLGMPTTEIEQAIIGLYEGILDTLRKEEHWFYILTPQDKRWLVEAVVAEYQAEVVQNGYPVPNPIHDEAVEKQRERERRDQEAAARRKAFTEEQNRFRDADYLRRAIHTALRVLGGITHIEIEGERLFVDTEGVPNITVTIPPVNEHKPWQIHCSQLTVTEWRGRNVGKAVARIALDHQVDMAMAELAGADVAA